MTRGEAHQTKVHFKGKEDDFVVFVDDAKSAQDWRMNKSIPLERVVSALQIFVTHKLVRVSILITLNWSAPRSFLRGSNCSGHFFETPIVLLRDRLGGIS
jgi:hypothetical protein